MDRPVSAPSPDAHQTSSLERYLPGLRTLVAGLIVTMIPAGGNIAILLRWASTSLLLAGLCRLRPLQLPRPLVRAVVLASTGVWISYVGAMVIEIPSLPGAGVILFGTCIAFTFGFLNLLVQLRGEVERAGLPAVARVWSRSAWLWGFVYFANAGLWLILIMVRGGSSISTLNTGSAPLAFALFLVVLTPTVAFAYAVRRTSHAVAAPRGVCPNCGYDLFGMKTLRCPECGAPFDLEIVCRARTMPAAPRSWISRSLLSAGLAAPLAMLAYFQIPGNAMTSHKPFALLMRDALGVAKLQQADSLDQLMQSMTTGWTSADQLFPRQGAREAQEELLKRLANGALSREQVTKIVAAALRVQADPRLPMVRWADLFEEADRTGVASAAQRTQFFLTAPCFRLVVRDRTPAGAMPTFDIISTWRGPSEGTAGVIPRASEATQSIKLTVLSLSANDVPFVRDIGPRRIARSSGLGLASWGFEHEEIDFAAPPPECLQRPGPVRIAARVQVQWTPRGVFNWKSAAEMREAGFPLSWEVILTADSQVVPGALQALETSNAPNNPPNLDAWLIISCNNLGRFEASAPSGPVSERPHDYAFEVFALVDGQREPIGTLTWSKRSFQPELDVHLSPSTLDRIRASGRPRLTLVFVPSQDVAARTLDIQDLWTGSEVQMEIAAPP